MIAGRFAFQGLSDFLTWQKIKQLEYTFPEGFNVQAQDLIQRLLVRFKHHGHLMSCMLNVVRRCVIPPGDSVLASREPGMTCWHYAPTPSSLQ